MTNHDSTHERLGALRAADPEIWTVSDDDGLVQVSVGADGAFDLLRLSPQWWRSVRAEDVGLLILRLFRASEASRNQTKVELEEELGHRASAGETAPTVETPRTQGRAALSARLGNLLAAFSELDDYRRSVEAATRESIQLRSPSGNVTLELVGGTPRALDVDPYNVQFTPEQTLASEIVGLFQEADHWLRDQRDRVLGDLPELKAVVSSVRARTHPSH